MSDKFSKRRGRWVAARCGFYTEAAQSQRTSQSGLFLGTLLSRTHNLLGDIRTGRVTLEALARCTRCRETRHNSRTCKKDT